MDNRTSDIRQGDQYVGGYYAKLSKFSVIPNKSSLEQKNIQNMETSLNKRANSVLITAAEMKKKLKSNTNDLYQESI